MGLQRFRECPAEDESYYALARMQDHNAHEEQLKEQMARLDDLMKK
jgi:hypothetical protein